VWKESKSYFSPWFWFHQWRAQHIEKFNIARFNAREAAYAFLRQYDGENFVKAQKVKKFIFLFGLLKFLIFLLDYCLV